MLLTHTPVNRVPAASNAWSTAQACNGHGSWRQGPQPPSSPPPGRPRRQSPRAAAPSTSVWRPFHGQAPCADSSTSPFLRSMPGEQLCRDLQILTSCTNDCRPAQARTSAAAGRGLPCPGPNRLSLDADTLDQSDHDPLRQSGLSIAGCFSFQTSSQQLCSSRGQAGTARALTNDFIPSISRHTPLSSLDRSVSSQQLRPASPSFAFRRRLHLLNSCAHQSPGSDDRPGSHDGPCNSISSAEPQIMSAWLVDRLQVTPTPASSLQTQSSGTGSLLSADDGKTGAQPVSSIGAHSFVSCSGASSDTIGWVYDSPNLEGHSCSQQSPSEWGQISRDSLTSPVGSMDLLIQRAYQRPDIRDRPDTAWDP